MIFKTFQSPHRCRTAGLLLGLAFGAAPAFTGAANLAVSGKIGTLGPGLDLIAGLSDRISLRAGLNYFTYKHTVRLDEADVDGRLRLQTLPVLLDWFPTGGGFRFSGGIVWNANRICLSAKPNESMELSGTEYNIERLDGSIEFDALAPYFGIGYGHAGGRAGRWRMAFDLGAMYHGVGTVEAQAVASDPRMQQQVDRDLQQEVDSLQEDLRSFRFYPVLSIGVSYRF